jgi:exonuclease VII large subunit
MGRAPGTPSSFGPYAANSPQLFSPSTALLFGGGDALGDLPPWSMMNQQQPVGQMPYARDFLERIKAQVLAAIRAQIQQVIADQLAHMKNNVANRIDAAQTTVNNKINSVTQKVTDKMNNVMDAATNAVQNAGQKVKVPSMADVKAGVDGLVQNAGQNIADVTADVQAGAQNAVQQGQELKNKMIQQGQKVMNSGKNVLDKGKNLVNNVKDKFNKTPQKIKDAAANVQGLMNDIQNSFQQGFNQGWRVGDQPSDVSFGGPQNVNQLSDKNKPPAGGAGAGRNELTFTVNPQWKNNYPIIIDKQKHTHHTHN